MSIELETAVQETSSVFNPSADLIALNQQFDGSKPSEIMKFTVENATNPVIFTNFRPLAVAFLDLVTKPIKRHSCDMG